MPERGSREQRGETSDVEQRRRLVEASERRAGSLGKILTGEGPDREPRRCDLTLNALGDVLLRGEVSASLRQLIRERLDPIEARQDLFRVRHEDHYLDLAERDQV